jgi:molybdopterin/thiamine biosynthesis adenylyltransferase
LAKDEEGAVSIQTYEAARTDQEILLMRAGSDAAFLRTKKVTIIGAGAIGSHVAALLARSGLGELFVFDYQRLRPGDVVRHAANQVWVGSSKVDAVQLVNQTTAPWTITTPFDRSIWEPSLLGKAATIADLVVDATGQANFTAQLSDVCQRRRRPLLSVALYRRGFVGRVRYQAAEPRVSILDRPGLTRFPLIPAGPHEEGASWEAGCMASVAEAPPTAVVSIAATAAKVAIDAMTGRDSEDRDVLEVYRTLGTRGFDVTGTFVIR